MGKLDTLSTCISSLPDGDFYVIDKYETVGNLHKKIKFLKQNGTIAMEKSIRIA